MDTTLIYHHGVLAVELEEVLNVWGWGRGGLFHR